MASKPKTGLLLINLGTPDSPRTPDVRRYLRQFLMDPRVIDIPAWRRWLIVNLLILPFRPRSSAEAYRKIWTEAGSPLLLYSQELTRRVQARLGPEIEVELGMRYGRPAIGEAMGNLRRRGVHRLIVFPLYPQYSSAATGSSLEAVFKEAARLWNVPSLQVIPPFYDHEAFIAACAGVARPHLGRSNPERVFFSFHGLPERQVRKSDPTGTHCLHREDCCERIEATNADCYRAQCLATAKRLADALGIEEERRVVCFQSRLGRTPWLRPYTDEVLADHARRGCKRAMLLSPAFVADCLETLEELGIRGVEIWKEHGGESLELVPCVNVDEAWVDALVQIVGEQTTWLDAPASTSAVAAEGG